MTEPIRLERLDVDDPEAVAAAFAVTRDCEIAVLGRTDETLDSVRSALTGPIAWRDQHRFAMRGDQVVGVLAAELDEAAREVFIDGYAVGHDTRAVDHELMSHGLAAGIEHARRNPTGLPLPADPYALSTDLWQVVGGCPAADAEHADVLAGLGFRPIRRFWRMRRDLDGVTADVPPAPAGVARRRVGGDADRRVMHRLFTESFAQHFGSTHEYEYETWIEQTLALPGTDPLQWYIGTLEGEDVALCLCDDSRAESGDGYVRTLGVVDSARGRGIGRWLLECAAADAVGLGRSGLKLSVDGENTTGATALYESVGFVTVGEIDVWCFPVVD
jgi:mycothiol synthase